MALVYILIKVFVLQASPTSLFLYSISVKRIIIKTVKGCHVLSILPNSFYKQSATHMPLVNLEEIKNTLRFDFNLISKWFEENYTVLNADKSCFMCHISISNAY